MIFVISTKKNSNPHLINILNKKNVSMDLKVWRKLYFLNIVDLVTKFYTIVGIDDKQPKTIIKDFILCYDIKFL